MGILYTSYVINKITKYQARASGHTITSFHLPDEIFEVTIAPHGFHMDKGNKIQVIKLKKEHALETNGNHLVSHVHMC